MKDIYTALLATSSLLTPAAVAAQAERGPTGQQHGEGLTSSEVTDIVVTARKRDESSLTVPVIVAAVGAAELDRRAVVSLDAVARIVPQLLIAENNASIQGGNISIRGISGPDSNPFGDQAVSFNIDGVQIAKASLRRLGQLDMQQVEVLKGPQALFFGKNSPAGIISIRTADPTSRFEAKVQLGYEVVGREIRADSYISGPLTDTLGFRIAGYFSDLNGYFKNEVPQNAALKGGKRTPESRDYAVRGTLLYDQHDRLRARLKVSYAQTNSNSFDGTVQRLSCPFGAPQSGIADACKADNKAVHTGYGSVPNTLDLRFRADGEPYLNSRLWLAGLEINYDLADEVTFTSISGLFYNKSTIARNAEADYTIGLASNSPDMNREFSQEFRLATDYDAPINFTAGAYLSNTRASTGAHTLLFFTNPANPLSFLCSTSAPCQIHNFFLRQKGQAYSAFAQLSYKPGASVEITAGGRYSYERKSLPLVKDGLGRGVTNALGINSANILDASTIVHPQIEKASWNDFSPEVTTSWRPTTKLTLFASYKHGFLSGGFNAGPTDFTSDLSYNPQTIKGVEVGIKTLLLGDRLRVNLAAYRYAVKDLQITNFTNATGSIRNAGAVRVQGLELDGSYRPPVAGLSFTGAMAYNRGRYTSFPAAPCYNGQTTTAGCRLGVSAPIQDLSGTELIRAPEWSLSGGINYERPLFSGFKIGLSLDANYSSSFLTDATSNPRGRQPSFALLDGSIRLSNETDQWRLALIGRNLTNKSVFYSSSDVPFTGTTATGIAAGNSTQVLGDRFGAIGRGREVLVQASYRF